MTPVWVIYYQMSDLCQLKVTETFPILAIYYSKEAKKSTWVGFRVVLLSILRGVINGIPLDT